MLVILGALPKSGSAWFVYLANDLMVGVGEVDLGATILTTVIISTVFSEAIGSYGTRFAITRAGEIGKAKPDPDPEHTRHTHELQTLNDENRDTLIEKRKLF